MVFLLFEVWKKKHFLMLVYILGHCIFDIWDTLKTLEKKGIFSTFWTFIKSTSLTYIGNIILLLVLYVKKCNALKSDKSKKGGLGLMKSINHFEHFIKDHIDKWAKGIGVFCKIFWREGWGGMATREKNENWECKGKKSLKSAI